VGEASAGAGIAGSYITLKRNLIVCLPFKMVVAPHSQTGWEGTGVIPDSVSKNKDALVETRRFIWQDILKNSKDSTLKATVQWQIDDSKANDKMKSDWQNRYKGLAGRYIITSNNGLIWRKAEPGKVIQNYVLKEVKQDIFTIVDLNEIYGHYSTRIYIQRNATGQISQLNEKILLPNGAIYEVSEPFKKQ